MHDFVRKMIDEMDEDVANWGSGRSLVLFGDRESRYLKDVEKKAAALHLEAVWDPEDAAGEVVPVLDLECRDDSIITSAHYYMDQYNDIDCVEAPGLSCCADACFRIIQNCVPSKALVTISGRGHSQKGLYDALAREGYTTLAMHSESNKYFANFAVNHSGVIVNTSKKVEWNVFPRTPYPFVLDVCGTGQEIVPKTYLRFSPQEIGALNISILLRRFVEA